ncbi:gamma-glutamylcyclotransferase family protein [Patulibacter defluvii]|uniref:gamma-glutamylcyclotransferase family protein n=1 Tax=Patulibacter defluvii TaxID=3095358 RepID=UPI002A748008|nr:gamma-glutamylcyclotransferase family protein [Patulibacter sp. DM4]
MLRGYVFGYGSLVADALPLTAGVERPVAPVWGRLDDHRRRWTVTMRNRDRVNDPKHVVDEATGRRPDLWVTYVTLDRVPGTTVNGIAVPVDDERLAVFDVRELNYERVAVGELFTADPGEAWPPPGDGPALPVWTYVASAAGRERYEQGRQAQRAVVRAGYRERVEGAFRDRGAAAWRDYQASTDPPAVPTRDGLRLVRTPPRAGGIAPTGS